MKNCRVCRKKMKRVGLCKECTQKYRYPHKKITPVAEIEELPRNILHEIIVEREYVQETKKIIIQPKDLFMPYEVLASFEGAEEINVIVSDQNKKEELKVINGSSAILINDFSNSEISLEIQIDQKILINILAVGFMNMEAIPVFLDSSIIINNPEQSKSIGFHLDCILESAGNECVDRKQVQIRNSDGSISTIENNESKFVWRDFKLYCDLPTGYQKFIRVRFSTKRGWQEWSNWLPFTPKRRMSL